MSLPLRSCTGLLLLLVVLLIACENDTTNDPPAPSPTEGASAANSCPDSDRTVCDFAAEVEQLLLAGAGEQLADRSLPQEVTCGAEAGSPSPAVCETRTAGARVQGYAVGRTYSEGTILGRSEYAAFVGSLARESVIDARDDYGPGALRLYSIGSGGNAAGCDECRVLAFSRVIPVPPDQLMREGVFFRIEKQQDGWTIRLALTGVQMGRDFPVKLRGGLLEGTEYVVWNAGEQPTTPPGDIWLGARVAVKGAGDCLNVRENPSREATVIDCLPDGTPLQVIGGPTTREMVRWWRVMRPQPLYGFGWVSAEFIGDPQ